MIQRTINVLVIEDEPSVADALKMILEDQGYGVVVAITGREGITYARRHKFDVTLTDLRLPDITGIDVLNAICKEKLGGLMILTTAYATSEVELEAKACGAMIVLKKPFLLTDLIEKIDFLLAAQCD